MKGIIIVLAALLCIAGCGAGNSYEIAAEPHGTKIVTGKFSPSLLESDSAFTWYRTNYDAFNPDSTSVAFLSHASHSVHFIVVGGTWCGDTKRELPKFFKTMALAHVPESNVELYGVDRSKKSKDGLTEKYQIVQVPTIIVVSDGKEMGRIIESATEGMEIELANIVRKK